MHRIRHAVVAAAGRVSVDAVLARQGRALEAAKTVSEGLVRAIADEVAAQRTTGSGYGQGGAASAPAPATSITLNKRA